MVGRANVAALSLASTALLGACGGGGGGGGESEATVSGEYALVWSDEFNEDGLPDPTKWAYDTYRNSLGGWYNNELQYYSANDPDNAKVENGNLVITARNETVSVQGTNPRTYSYTSARLITQGLHAWTYGRFEIRAKTPCNLGTWPAIWTLGAVSGVWPNIGEIDIMEQKGFNAQDKDRVSAAVHFPDRHAGNALFQETSLPNACTTFNIYHLNWETNRIVIGVNGRDYFTYSKPADPTPQNWPFDHPHYLLLNIAVGGALGGSNIQITPSNPAVMEVDYVRIYQRQPR